MDKQITQSRTYVLKPEEYELSSVLSFGKYKGKTIRQVLAHNPIYVQWCIHNIGNFRLSEKAQAHAEKVFQTMIKPKLKQH